MGQRNRMCHNADRLVNSDVLAQTYIYWQIFKPCLIFWSSSIQEELYKVWFLIPVLTKNASPYLNNSYIYSCISKKIRKKISTSVCKLNILAIISVEAVLLLPQQTLLQCLFRQDQYRHANKFQQTKIQKLTRK